MTNSPIDLDALRSNVQRVRELIASLTTAGAGEEVLEPLRRSETQLQQQIVTGGAFVGRDQTIHQVSAVQGVSLAEFTALLAELRAALPAAGLDPDTAEIIDADVQVIEEQAAKPKPSAAIITSKLEGIAKLLAAAGGVAVAAQKLLPLAQQALEWARPLFG